MPANLSTFVRGDAGVVAEEGGGLEGNYPSY